MYNFAMDPMELAGIARARAAFDSFLSIHFNSLPDESFVEQMRKPEVLSMLALLSDDESVSEDLAQGASLMYGFIEETREEKPAQLSEKLGVDRTRLYRGVSPSYGPPPPYEMVWSKTYQDTRILQILASEYREKGLEPSSQAIDRLDYIGMELDFLRILALREAEAWETGDVDAARTLLGEQQQFFCEHLEDWVPRFVAAAFEHVVTDFYKGHLLVLRGFAIDGKEEFLALAEQVKEQQP